MKRPKPKDYHDKVKERLEYLKTKKEEALIHSIVNYQGDDLIEKEKQKNLKDYRVFQEFPGNYKIGEAELSTVYETPLHFAAKRVLTSLFKLLCSYDADLVRANSLGQTPAMIASESGAFDIIDFLIEKRVLNPNTKAAYSSRTALHYALIGQLNDQKHSIAIRLIEAGADCSLEDRTFKTPMSEAIRHANFELVKLMLKKGYNINYRTSSHKTVAFNAYDKAAKSFKKSMLPKTNVARTALMEALARYSNKNGTLSEGKKKNLKDIILTFIETPGIDLDQADSEGITTLMYAVKTNDLDVVKAVMERGANSDIKTSVEGGVDVYEIASSESSSEITRYLAQVKKEKEEGLWIPKSDFKEEISE
jgi:ankyrin repeat protein